MRTKPIKSGRNVPNSDSTEVDIRIDVVTTDEHATVGNNGILRMIKNRGDEAKGQYSKKDFELYLHYANHTGGECRSETSAFKSKKL